MSRSLNGVELINLEAHKTFSPISYVEEQNIKKYINYILKILHNLKTNIFAKIEFIF